MLFFSSSRWPLVVSTGTFGVLPGPLWLLVVLGNGRNGFFKRFGHQILHCIRRRNAGQAGLVPGVNAAPPCADQANMN